MLTTNRYLLHGCTLKRIKPTDLLTTSFQPSSLFWPLLGLVRLSLLLGEVRGRAMVLNGEGKEWEVQSLVSRALGQNNQGMISYSSCWLTLVLHVVHA